MLLMGNAKYFPTARIPEIKQTLEQLGPEKASQVMACGFKDPTTALILGVVVGTLGIDRFYIGDNTLGILKIVYLVISICIVLLSCGILFFVPWIWQVIDLIYITGATKEKNYQQFLMNIQYL